MPETILTKAAYRTLCIMYKAYLDRREKGESYQDAAVFFDSYTFRTTYMPEVNSYDFSSLLYELHKNDYVIKFTDDGFKIEKSTIILMENRFKNGIKELAAFISQFIP